ncbi:aldehyde dehydrogenase family protein [Ureibacillus chungkukjangi]|uniref:aldehyde dehydrogenase family protein n=1 Tax=Ureibacillus chungkukjangi TaxID=1202712 RepID=UPI00203F04AB|nr:aldehyde dehydrogenase family protein [Ureibacillus chungkukjangi]MCM3389244.1 aldehyde dehydrogenase family protein [Ureibacillus chungkukjangi]
MLLAGEWIIGTNLIDVENPQDGEIIAQVPAANKEEVLFAIQEGVEGAGIASRLSTFERMGILKRAADWIEERQTLFAETIATEGSKTIREARKEVKRCIETIRISAEEARRIHGETIPFDQTAGNENRVGYYQRFPIGLIVAITPFNDPLNLVAHKLGPAIAAGNSIIIKPSSVTPISALLLAEAFTQAGLPKKILSVITGHSSEIGDVLVAHPDVRMISFTGGYEAGKIISSKAGIKKLSMELGSNSPCIVLKDADIPEAVKAIASGAFWAAGQNCLGVQRVYIEKEVYKIFEELVVEATKQLSVGDKLSEETEMGPLITEREAIRIEKLVQEALRNGALLLCGGTRKGAFYSPTVLTNVDSNSKIAQEEIFGPVLILEKVNDLEEAIQKSNNVSYGLQAGIFTQNLDNAFKAIRELDCGGVIVNDSSDFRIDAMPFGGVKQSGIGREGVAFSIQEMTEQKVICFKLNSNF